MIYEYECTDDGSRWEEQRKVDDRDGPSTCPYCGCRGVRVVSAGVSHVLKGGGWYRDGYSTHVGDTMPKALQGERYK